jgi:hypothetical protein
MFVNVITTAPPYWPLPSARFHTLSDYFYNSHFNIIPFMPRSPTWFCPSGLRAKTTRTLFLPPTRATCPEYYMSRRTTYEAPLHVVLPSFSTFSLSSLMTKAWLWFRLVLSDRRRLQANCSTVKQHQEPVCSKHVS